MDTIDVRYCVIKFWIQLLFSNHLERTKPLILLETDLGGLMSVSGDSELVTAAFNKSGFARPNASGTGFFVT